MLARCMVCSRALAASVWSCSSHARCLVGQGVPKVKAGESARVKQSRKKQKKAAEAADDDVYTVETILSRKLDKMVCWMPLGLSR